MNELWIPYCAVRMAMLAIGLQVIEEEIIHHGIGGEWIAFALTGMAGLWALGDAVLMEIRREQERRDHGRG